jgi:hypothetical protein
MSKKAILAMNLSDIKAKLVSDKKWTQDRADETEKWYRRFLTLAVKYPDKPLVPTPDIDEMWHLHILDTKKYAKDCRAIFGRFFHHVPNYGDRHEQLAAEFVVTNSLFKSEFGEGLNLKGLQVKTCDNPSRVFTCDNPSRVLTCDNPSRTKTHGTKKAKHKVH